MSKYGCPLCPVLQWGEVSDGREVGSADADCTLEEDFQVHVKPNLAEELPEHSDVAVVTSSAGKNGMWKAMDLSDKVQLILKFGCRFIKFKVAEIEPPPKRSRLTGPSAFDVLLGAAAPKDRLPEKRRGTAKDELYNDVVDHLEVQLICFSSF